jgi:nucleoporin SEH1
MTWCYKWHGLPILASKNEFFNSGHRSYELIATASKDGFVRLFQLNHQKTKLDCEMIEELSHGAEVWGLEWNMTGTILSSSGDNGQVKLWKAAIYDHWTCISVIEQ